MKKVTLILSLFLASSLAFSQTKVTKDANGNYIQVKALKKASEDKATGQTLTLPNGDVYPIYESVNGKLYIKRISKNGNEYKQYLKTEN
jgi:hypothetical protein